MSYLPFDDEEETRTPIEFKKTSRKEGIISLIIIAALLAIALMLLNLEK